MSVSCKKGILVVSESTCLTPLPDIGNTGIRRRVHHGLTCTANRRGANRRNTFSHFKARLEESGYTV